MTEHSHQPQPDDQQLAELLVHYSCQLQPGENILLNLPADEPQLAQALLAACYQAGGRPFLQLNDNQAHKAWLQGADDTALSLQAAWEAERMRRMDAFISFRKQENLYDMTDVADEVQARYNRLLVKPVHFDIRVPDTKWVILRYPNASMAQAAHLPTAAFRDFYYRVCCFDYERLSQAMDPLKARLDAADLIEIQGEQVDLRFSVKGIGAVKCDGQRNIPDGEVYTAPCKHSLQGEITYNTPSPEQGQVFERLHFVFDKGKIVQADCAGGPARNRTLNAILDTDEGARYVGEFSFGLHPLIMEPMLDTLFDEKICGSFHLTPGSCYEDAPNGTLSAIHWDIVYIMRESYGGCRVRIDGELIQENGIFLPADLAPLNREHWLTTDC